MASICDLNNQKAHINYPTMWEYKVIVEAHVDVNALVRGLIDDGRQHKIEFSNFSKDKKYASHSVVVHVFDERERLELFLALKKSAKFVL
ncbi:MULTISPECIES: HP0495 family protein [unclassified Campylobacter]|uniref:HP0495 family protein n=1 Tax=unclassified Campylobacter TaxID=2593542 RepID=UPI003D32F2E8